MSRRLPLALCLAFLIALLCASTASAFGPIGKFGAPGTAAGQFADMYGIAIDPAGDVWVPDNDGQRIEKFTSTGQFLLGIGWGVKDGAAAFQTCTTSCQMGIQGNGDGQFDAPRFAATDAAGNLYVTDEGNNRVEKFNSAGAFLGKFGSTGTGAGQFTNADGIAVSPGGDVYVVDSGIDRIDRFTANGQFVSAFGWGVLNGAAALQTCTTTCQAGIPGNGDGQLDTATDLDFGPNGQLYVNDRNNNRVQRFSADGAFLGKFGSTGSGPGQFGSPSGVGTAPDGSVYVGDNSNHRIAKFDANGNFLLAFGWGVQDGAAAFQICTTSCQAGTAGPGAGQIDSLESLATNCRGTLYVPDYNVLDVQVFGETGVRQPPCPSNAFTLGKVKRNKRKGTATIPVTLPGPGTLALTGKGLVTQRPAARAGTAAKTVSAAGTVKLTLKVKKAKLKRKLKKTGKLKVAATITYTPNNGDPAAQTLKTKLVKKLKHRHH